MSRKIKFRMWDAENSVMIDGDSLAFEEYAPITTLLSQEGIMQYTGLKDKHGKEIYEGDMVKDYKDTGIVEWADVRAGFCITFRWENNGKQDMFYDELNKNSVDASGDISINKDSDRDHRYEVIGNIYENPNLLKP